MEPSKLIKRCKRHPLVDVSSPTYQPVDLGRDALYQILPNREPFIFLDRVVGIDSVEQAVVATRKIDPSDPLFRGHFPEMPVYPGVLQLEMIAELFCCCYYFTTKNRLAPDGSKPVRLVATRMHDCLLQHGVFPGDEVTVMTKVLHRHRSALRRRQTLRGRYR